MAVDHSSERAMFEAVLHPWYEALSDPGAAQQQVLRRFLRDYAQTEYGARHGAAGIQTIAEYRDRFPIATYSDYLPLIRETMEGNHNALLAEQPAGWAITRGTTSDEPKFIPMTPTDIALRISAGRAMMQYVVAEDRFDLFDGVNLNLNFPSVVGTLDVKDRKVDYGYSSGIYARYVTRLTPLRSTPTQEQIDELGGGKTISAWEARFELAYQECLDENVTLVGGVAPTAVSFAQYLYRRHRRYPKDIWRPLVATLGSVPGINTRYRPILHALYGSQLAIREIYGTTEGIFGQQMDERRAWLPNYDLYFFEVGTVAGVKMLYEMRRGEMGSLIVSTPALPRYKIGDRILAVAPPCFRCIGRDRWYTPLRYAWDEFLTLNLGQL
ncbi:MAG: GH3 auxin-responsive promoter family protein [Chloroflexi bacterium]|nr:GH3 auxin-responsive promoter family protein [Chloroflexota bacterium]